MKQELSIPRLAQNIATEGEAYLFLEGLRWANGVVCPHCGATGRCFYLNPANGNSRATRTGSVSRAPRVEVPRVPQTVLRADRDDLSREEDQRADMAAWSSSRCGQPRTASSAREVERKYELTAKTAWYMMHRIREAMKREPLAGLLSGTVQADETFIGGKPKNRHRNDKREPARRYATTDKTPVFALVHYETREVRSRVVANVNGQTLLPAIHEHVPDGSHHVAHRRCEGVPDRRAVDGRPRIG